MVASIAGATVCGTREIDMHQPKVPAAAQAGSCLAPGRFRSNAE
jgi:hypothetical protein